MSWGRMISTFERARWEYIDVGNVKIVVSQFYHDDQVFQVGSVGYVVCWRRESTCELRFVSLLLGLVNATVV